MKYKIIHRGKLVATVLLDSLLQALFFPVNLLRRRQELAGNIREILIIRTAYAGDVVMTMPILKPLKQRFPQARISFITSRDGCALLKNNPWVDRLLPFEPFWFYKSGLREYVSFIAALRREKFDLVIEARGDLRDILLLAFPLKSRFRLSYGFGGGACLLTHVAPFTGVKHRVEYHLDLVRSIGCSSGEIEWGLLLTPEEEQTVEAIMNEHGIVRPFAAAHPGSRLPLKRWPQDKCAELYDMIIEKFGMQVVIVGSGGETGLASSIEGLMKRKPVNLAGKLRIGQLAGILSKADFMVCNDSAPMHVAVAMGTPVVAIFGPSKSQETRPFADNCRVVEKAMPCRWACNEQKCRYTVFNHCIRDISTGDVFRAINDAVKQTRWNKSNKAAQQSPTVNP